MHAFQSVFPWILVHILSFSNLAEDFFFYYLSHAYVRGNHGAAKE